jgi:hypothetical protein
MAGREYSYVRTVIAGCFDCWGSEIRWEGPNAQGVAAQHHDKYGHRTWVEVHMTIYYGGDGEGAELSDPQPAMF